MGTITLVLLVIALLGVIIFQIAKANEYVAQLKGEEAADEETDNINAWMWIAFGALFFIGIFWSTADSWPRMILESASVHGRWIDFSFNITTFFTGLVFVATHVMLFYFAYRYRGKRGKVAYYYPENNKLEMIWTIVPAIVLTVLIVIGLYNWFRITSPAPKNAHIVEVTGRQFSWLIRYPGKDGKLGKKEFKLIDEVNSVGVDFSDPDSRDDIIYSNEIHVMKGQPVLLKINSRDVIHDVGIPYFSVKMDAVPGMPTHFWFTPMFTTEEMAVKTGNPNFQYEIACDMLCGKGHSNMRGVIVVHDKEGFYDWYNKQPSFYDTQVKGTELEKKFALKTTGTGAADALAHN